jgi:hypothetical protein
MKAPNSELFRLLRFAIRYPGWHPYQGDAAPHIRRGTNLEFFEVDKRPGREPRFRLATPDDSAKERAKTEEIRAILKDLPED